MPLTGKDWGALAEPGQVAVKGVTNAVVEMPPDTVVLIAEVEILTASRKFPRPSRLEGAGGSNGERVSKRIS